MNNSNLTFNLLTFNHPEKEYTFYFTNKETDGTQRIYHTLVPTEVAQHFGEQDHYYTSFTNPLNGLFPVTKQSSISSSLNKTSEERRGLSYSLLKRYYNQLIHSYFKSLNHLVKPNFISDTEIWIHSPKQSGGMYNIYERFSIKAQIARITNKPELLITYEGKSKVFKQNVYQLLDEVSPEYFNWVVYNNQLFRYKNIPDFAKRDLTNVFPVWNFDIRNSLNQKTEAPSHTNKYEKFHNLIKAFIAKYLNTDNFKALIPLTNGQLTKVQQIKINSVNSTSNQLLFGNKHLDLNPMSGLKSGGPLELVDSQIVHFFYICHQDNKKQSNLLHTIFNSKHGNFNGLNKFLSIPYHIDSDLSLTFKDKENPLPEISDKLQNASFSPDISYIAIYVSPFSKDNATPQQKNIYYHVKELLLRKDITSQVIDVNKITDHKNFQYSLNNISIAVLAKLGGVPWRLNTKLKNELIVGVGAFKQKDTNQTYIGSAFSFANSGKFNKFECFQHNQTDELAGSIIDSIKNYVSYSHEIKRLVIHYYKEMSNKEFDPIKKGLQNLGLNIPVYIISINKTVSHDIIAFDNNWKELMPMSGTFVNIGFNKFLLFNNTRYNPNFYSSHEGYPFPIKIGITCSIKEMEMDINVIKQLIDQVYQFSRMYWKSLKQQNLPVTIKYPEMVAEMLPHFTNNEIPEFGKDNLWFL